ncbi:MAG: hypothetical protein HY787_27330 [Deltaproteobacteria bacterium]|nr:hypothetical protein [Deltaproteobacteria bacterium]
MNYSELSQVLLRLSQTTGQHHHELEGLTLAKAADSLVKATLRFQKKLEDFLGGRGPGIQELEELLVSPQARAHLKLPALNLIHKDLFGDKLTSEKPAAAKKEFINRAKKEQAGEKSVELLRLFFLKAAQRPPLSKNEAALQEEFLRLGGLSDEELAFEFSDRLKSVGLLKALARANAIPFSKEISKEKLIEQITHYARRAYGNIRHRA